MPVFCFEDKEWYTHKRKQKYMKSHEKNFDEWHKFYLVTSPKSEEWYEALDGMHETAACSEDWQELHRALIYDGFPINHPEVVICTNGILIAPRRGQMTARNKGSFAEVFLQMFGFSKAAKIA